MYYCFYDFFDRYESRMCSKFVLVDSIGDVCDGFWINGIYQFTKGSDCKWWIPPSAIIMVEKLDGPSNQD